VTGVFNYWGTLQNVFFKTFEAIPGMAELYRNWESQLTNISGYKTSFHYVSGMWWNLYPDISEFIQMNGFPEGDTHLRPPIYATRHFFFGPRTKLRDHKTARISRIMEEMPQRKFILIGDSGQIDA